MTQTISIYDTQWGKFLTLSLCQNTFTLRITNNQNCILLFFLAPQPTPLYSVVCSAQSGACTTAQSKELTIQLYPQFDLTSVTVPYQIPIVLARADISKIFTLYDINLTEKSLMESFDGRKFYLSIVIRRHDNLQLLKIQDIELVENTALKTDGAARPALNVYKLLEKALVILKTRYYHFKNKNADEAIIEPYTQQVLKFKISLDYWKYLSYADRIGVVNGFLDFLKQAAFCPICFVDPGEREAVYCGQCGSFIGCCQEHAQQFSALHFPECYEFRAIMVLKFLYRNDMEMTIAQDIAFQHSEEKSTAPPSDEGRYVDSDRERWIYQASDHILETDRYLNEICDFVVSEHANPDETDDSKIQQLVDYAHEHKVEYLDIYYSVDEMMQTFYNVYKEKQQFYRYLQSKYGARLPAAMPKVTQSGAPLHRSSSADYLTKDVTAMNEDVSRILDQFDYAKGNGFYASAIQKIQHIYSQTSLTLQNDMNAFKLHKNTYLQQMQELADDFTREFDKIRTKFPAPDALQAEELFGEEEAEEELLKIRELYREAPTIDDIYKICQNQRALIDLTSNLQIRAFDRQKQVQELDRKISSTNLAVSELQKYRQQRDETLLASADFYEKLYGIVDGIEGCIYDYEAYQRMKNRKSVDLTRLKQQPKLDLPPEQQLEYKELGAPEQTEAQTLEASGLPEQSTEFRRTQQAVERGTTFAVNIKRKTMQKTHFEPLEHISEQLITLAREFNDIRTYAKDSYFKLFSLARKAHSTVFRNLQRMLRKTLAELGISYDLQDFDISMLKRHFKSLQTPPQIAYYFERWCAVAEEHEALQEQIERQVFYCMAYTPEVLTSYPKEPLPIPEIDFRAVDEQSAAMLMDGVEDL